MKVLHVIPSLDPRAGGPTTALIGLTRAQVQVGMDVYVVTTREQVAASIINQLKESGVHSIEIEKLPAFKRPSLEILCSIKATVSGADIIHIHSLWHSLGHYVARFAHQQHIPYLIRPCGMLDPWSLNQSRFKKQLYLKWRERRNLECAAALHFTATTERDLTSPLRLSSPAIVEPNGLNLAEFETLPAPNTFRKQYPQLLNCPMVLFLSRLHPKKGLDLLIPSFAQCGDEPILVIAGPDDNGYKVEVEKLVAKFHLQERVLFTGMIQGKDRVVAFADADVFVLPSYQENFGNVVIESLAAQTPVVISDQVNIHAEITSAGVGEVVSLDIQVLAAALRRWLGDPELRRVAADKARPFVWENYDWLKIAQRWKQHYSDILNNSQ